MVKQQFNFSFCVLQGGGLPVGAAALSVILKKKLILLLVFLEVQNKFVKLWE